MFCCCCCCLLHAASGARAMIRRSSYEPGVRCAYRLRSCGRAKIVSEPSHTVEGRGLSPINIDGLTVLKKTPYIRTMSFLYTRFCDDKGACVLHIKNRSFCLSTSSAPSVGADSLILERYELCCHKPTTQAATLYQVDSSSTMRCHCGGL